MILNLVYECWRVKANFGPIRVLFQAFPFRQSSLLLSIPSTAATQRKTLVNNWLCSLLSERPKSMLYFTALINGLRKNKREQPIKAIMLHAIICSKSRRTKCAFWCFLMTILNCHTRQAFLFKNSVVSFANFCFRRFLCQQKFLRRIWTRSWIRLCWVHDALVFLQINRRDRCVKNRFSLSTTNTSNPMASSKILVVAFVTYTIYLISSLCIKLVSSFRWPIWL